jgi:hypothetical protein
LHISIREDCKEKKFSKIFLLFPGNASLRTGDFDKEDELLELRRTGQARKIRASLGEGWHTFVLEPAQL